jgi:hypothetical protein
MGLLDPNSLANTLSNINQALLEGKDLSRLERNEAASWIASRVACRCCSHSTARCSGPSSPSRLGLHRNPRRRGHGSF